ncbi:ABC transporter permease [Bacillus sp. CGMCC 1.16607]|uniref:ABC transporter permease n=1 Tax=Bacillus sp. CGMCC 1.16607 TaxID=3351842 RepID=UPI00363A0701
MFQFIIKNWLRNKKRMIPMFIGALIISSGLGYISGVQETSRGTIEHILQKKWRSSYDIVVRPPDSRSITEDHKLLEPNYLSGISGGISLEQLGMIKNIDEVAIAAPIAVIGNTSAIITFDKLHRQDLKDPGVYSFSYKTMSDNGVRKEERETYTEYFTTQEWAPQIDEPSEYLPYGVVYWPGLVSSWTNQLLVGVDPIEEAKLVGLEQSIIPIGESRYFTDQDIVTESEGKLRSRNIPFKISQIPIIVSKEQFVTETYEFTIKKLDLPFSDREIARETMETVLEKGGIDYLKTIESKEVEHYTYDSKLGHQIYLAKMTGIDPETQKPYYHPKRDAEFSWSVSSKAAPLDYKEIQSPFKEKWNYAFEVQPKKISIGENVYYAYRPYERYTENLLDAPKIEPYYVGLYDPSKLSLTMDPLTDVPMETYRPATASLVLDKNGKPINPPATINNEGKPFSLLTSPPVLLTTIEAAKSIMGDKPISAIRVKVSGVEKMNEDSQAILEKVARTIEEKTGLITDITLGSSPQPTLSYIPDNGPKESLGWIEQPWVKLGTAFGIYKESKVGSSALMFIIMLVAIIYVISTNIVSFLSQKKELALLLAIGWRNGNLVKMVLYEALILGVFVAVASLLMSFVAYFQSDDEIPLSIVKFILIGIVGFFIYLLGAIVPAFIVGRIKPKEAMSSGEISQNSRRLTRVRGIFTMAIGHFFGKWKRNALSVASIMLPTSLLMFFIFVSFRLKGVLYTTWLGQFVAMEIGVSHYIIIGVSLLIAILTTYEIMWQNVSERSAELSVLKAFGWSNRSVQSLVLTEGLISGILSGLFGYLVALGFINLIYHQLLIKEIWLISIAIIPVIVGLVGAFIPAQFAVRISPVQGMSQSIDNYKDMNQRAQSRDSASL